MRLKFNQLNPKLKKIILEKEKKQKEKLELIHEEQKSTSPARSSNVYEIIKCNKEAKVIVKASDDEVAIVFKGARLITVNVMFNLLESRKYDLFSYKKSWHALIKNALAEIAYQLQGKGKRMPFFDSNVEITLFRQAKRTVDEDAMMTMFKYIIDGLKKSSENPIGILADDNKMVINNVVTFNEKGDYAVGIKIKRTNHQKEKCTIDSFLAVENSSI